MKQARPRKTNTAEMTSLVLKSKQVDVIEFQWESGDQTVCVCVGGEREERGACVAREKEDILMLYIRILPCVIPNTRQRRRTFSQ